MSSPRRDQSPFAPALVRAFHQDTPSEAELTRAYARFLQRRSRRRQRSRLQVPLGIAAGMLLGLGSLYAATSVPLRWWSFGRPHVDRSYVEPAGAPDARRQAAERALPPPNAPAPAVTAVPSSAAGRGVTPAASIARESWERAARGLRERDLAAADDALQKLAQQGEVSEREKAQLVRAQLLLSQGRGDEARSLLDELSRHGGSPALRAKAATLLGSLQRSTDSHRSFELDAGTK